MKHRLNIFDIILFCIAMFILLFVIVMIIVFCVYQSVPDSLIGGVFGLCAGECGFMAWIERKEKEIDGEYNQEDREPYND